MQMHKNQSVNVHQFAMVPKKEIPRSAFTVQKTHKTTFDSGWLIPIHLAEVLPGDKFSLDMTGFARLATPLFPIMDNLHLDTFWFYMPNRMAWTNFVKMMGEQANPGDSISYTIPQQVTPAGGYAKLTLQDYLGLPTVGQVTAGKTVSHSAIPLRMYNLIWDKWFRDENLQNAPTLDTGDGPDNVANYTLLKRGKRPDYFTTGLPWPQKGGAASQIPLGGQAPVKGIGVDTQSFPASPPTIWDATGAVSGGYANARNPVAANMFIQGTTAAGLPNIYADLTQATAATINQLRQSIAIQQLLERDARGGTRYIEQVFERYGVRIPDLRLTRPEYLGGSSNPITINPIAQTSATGLTGGTTPVGNLAAMGTSVTRNGFTQSFTEHGYIMGLVMVRADLTYQQGLQRHWSRLTRYDIYDPTFANLGEQTILNKEIYVTGDATDTAVFAYQERWAEYRYDPSQITGLFRSTTAGTIDPWHLSQKFTGVPTLNSTFIQENVPLSRTLAVGAAADGQQIIFDCFISNRMARPMPMYGVPGLKTL